ncbi:MAG: chorismate synthase [Deltaproteobacteria bacterium]|nr:chorismate synthase [Deltaproteobacteria bacterium]
MLRYLTAGESHGSSVVAILEGMPAGLRLLAPDIDAELERRQKGYGRGGRMRLEKDRIDILSGIRFGLTLGSPICLDVKNLDRRNWGDIMSIDVPPLSDAEPVTRPRPGHADLAGGLKYNHHDLRNVLERSSARETAARVAIGACAKRLLKEFGMRVVSWVSEIGGAGMPAVKPMGYGEFDGLYSKAERSEVRCPDQAAAKRMMKRIDRAKLNGDSLGGIIEVACLGVAPGLGSHVHWDRKLDGRLAHALMSVQAIKGVEVGIGFAASRTPGSKTHDEVFYRRSGRERPGKAYWPQTPGFYRRTNNAGGIEGGTSNGEPVLLRAVMKPIPTLYKPLRSVDINTKKPYFASIERSDITAVPAASVVAEAVVALEISSAFLEKFGNDSIHEIERNYRGYLRQLAGF